MTAQGPITRTREDAGDILLLIGGLAVASTLELAVLRTFTRTAIHIPALESLQTPYKLLTTGGEYAYFVAIALLLPAFVVMGVQLFRARAPFRHLATFGVTLFALPASLAIAGVVNGLALDLGTITSVGIVSAAFALSVPQKRTGVPVFCFVAAFATSGLYGAIPALNDAGIQLAQPKMLLNAAELLGVAYALTLPLMLHSRIERKDWLAGAVAGILVLAVFLGNGSTSRFLLLWNIGLSGILPSIFYAVAAGSIVVSGVSLVRSGRALQAAGLLLLVTGGIGLHSTYQSALVVAGLATLCCAATQVRGVRSKPVSRSLEMSG